MVANDGSTKNPGPPRSCANSAGILRGCFGCLHQHLVGGERQGRNMHAPAENKYSWIGHRCQLGLTPAFGMLVSDFNSESRFGILLKPTHRTFNGFFDKTKIEFSDFCVSALSCNILSFDFSVFHQPWWLRRRFSARRSPMVVNEGVLESPEPFRLRVTIMSMSRGCYHASWGRVPWQFTWHGSIIASSQNVKTM